MEIAIGGLAVAALALCCAVPLAVGFLLGRTKK